jgi:hypothetical protein
MSDYRAIWAVGETLKSLLWSNFQADSTIAGASGILPDENAISFDPLGKLAKDDAPDKNFLSIFLYRVTENPEMKNRPFQQLDPNRLHVPPLALNLYYLITPLTNTADNDHRLLGKTMQVLYDNPVLDTTLLDPILKIDGEDLRVILNPASLDDLNKVWSGLLRSFRLSVSYEVKVVFIDSQRETIGEPVVRKHLGFGQKVSTR